MKVLYIDKEQAYADECKRLRQLRLKQVHQIAKQNAAKVRESFKKAQNKEINKILNEKREAQEKQHAENLAQMERVTRDEIDRIGQGHTMAANYNDGSEENAERQAENERRALERGRVASEAAREKRQSVEDKENAHIVARRQALEQERERSAKIAKLPKPVDEIAKLFDAAAAAKSSKLVTVHDSNVFASTSYHMPEHIVDKADTNEQMMDAKESAVVEEKRLKEAERDASRTRNERMEKARLRGKHALEKEVLAENYQEILGELSVLQKADREKRQRELGNIPKQIFVPSWQREQEKNEHQLELERQFEKIYIDENLRKEEMPQPMDLKLSEASESNLEDAELDLTLVDEVANNNNNNNKNVQQSQFDTRPVKLASNREEQSARPDEGVEEVPSILDKTRNDSIEISGLEVPKDKLNQLLLRIRAQKQVMAEKEARKAQSGRADLSDSSMSNLSSTSSLPSSRSNSPPRAHPLERPTNDESMTTTDNNTSTMSSNESEMASTENVGRLADDDGAMRARAMRAVMMSSHNVSSINEVELVAQQVAEVGTRGGGVVRTGRRKIARSSVRSVDLSHASRDPVVAAPKDILNKKEMKLALEYKQRLLDQEREQLERRLKELQEQEALIETTTSTTTQSSDDSSVMISSGGNNTSSHSNQANHEPSSKRGAADNSSGSAGIIDEQTSQVSQPTATSSSLAADEMARRIEFQNRLLSGDHHIQMSTVFDYARSVEQRKREIEARLASNEGGVATIRPPSGPASLASSDSVTAAGVNQAAVVDKQTVYSSDSGIGSGSGGGAGSNRLNSVASAAAVAESSLMKKPINLAVEQLNSEIQIMSAAKLFLNSDLSDFDEFKRRISQISSASSSSTSASSSLINSTSGGGGQFGLERYDSNSWTSWSGGVDDKSSSVSAISGALNQPHSSSDAESLRNDETSSDGDDDSDDASIDHMILSNLLRAKSVERSSREAASLERHTIESQLEAIRQQKESLDQQFRTNSMSWQQKPPIPAGVPVTAKSSRFVPDLNLHELSTIKEVDTPMSERNLKLVVATGSSAPNPTQQNSSNAKVSLISNNNKSSFTQVSSINQTTNNTTTVDETLVCDGKRRFEAAASLLLKTPRGADNQQLSPTKSSASTSTPLQSQVPIGESNAGDTGVKMSAETMRQKATYLLNLSLFDSSYSTSQKSSLDSSSSSSSQPGSGARNSKKSSFQNNNNNINTSAATTTTTTSKKWYDILASPDNNNHHQSVKEDEKSNRSELSVSTGPLSPSFDRLPSTSAPPQLPPSSSLKANQTLLDESSASDMSSLLEQTMKRSSLGSISPSSVLLNFSLASLPGLPAVALITNTTTSSPEARNCTNLSSPNAAEKTLEIRVPSSSAIQAVGNSSSESRQIAIESSFPNSIKTCSSLTQKSSENQESKSEQSRMKTTTTNNKSSSTQCSGLFDRFLKNYSSAGTTAATTSVLDEPEISFVSTLSTTSNPVSPHSLFKTAAAARNTMTTTKTSFSTSNSTTTNSTLQQQKRELSIQFDHLSPLDGSGNGNNGGGALSRRAAGDNDMLESFLTASIDFDSTRSASMSISNTFSSVSCTRNHFLNRMKNVNSNSIGPNDRLTTVSSLAVPATSDSNQTAVESSLLASFELSTQLTSSRRRERSSSPLIFTDLEPVMEKNPSGSSS